MKAYIILIVSILTIVLSCKNEDDITPNEMETSLSEDLIDQELVVPDSVIAAYEQSLLAKPQNSSARIGDNSRPGSISSVPGYSDRIRISGAAIGEICPNTLVNGDRDFNGGPWIKCSVTLVGSNNGIWAHVVFSAEETNRDQTKVTADKWVYVTSTGRRFRQFISDPFGKTVFRGVTAGSEFWGCQDGSIEHHTATEGAAVNRFNIIGDTGGDDVSSDDDCGCDTKIYTILLNDIVVKLM